MISAPLTGIPVAMNLRVELLVLMLPGAVFAALILIWIKTSADADRRS
jgi:hypothetical protein